MEIEKIREKLSYDADTGLFHWKISPKGGICVGDVAGHTKTHGYVVITVNGKTHFAHRLAWAYVHGSWPSNQIDHINRNRSDNRICNLQPATDQQNHENVSIRKDNSSGYRGVCWNKKHKKWVASIGVKNKRVYLGLFDDPKEGHAAYVKAASIYHTHNQEKIHG